MDLIKDKSKKVTADKTIAVDKNLVNKIELMPAKELVKEISSYLENDVLIRDGEKKGNVKDAVLISIRIAVNVLTVLKKMNLKRKDFIRKITETMTMKT